VPDPRAHRRLLVVARRILASGLRHLPGMSPAWFLSTSANPNQNRHHRGGAAVLFAAVFLVGLLLTGACTRATPTGNGSAPGEQADGANPAGGNATAPKPTVPDLLPDPGVDVGTCEMVTYTPPTSAQAQQGELCRPKSGQRDTAIVLVHGGSGVGGSLTTLQPWATRLGAEGYVTLNIDYHLFQPGYSNQSPVFPWPELNTMAAVQFLRGAGNALGLDKDRIVTQGHSAGARIGAVAYVGTNDDWFRSYDANGVSGDKELWPSVDTQVNGFVGFYHPYDGTMQYAEQYYGGAESATATAASDRWAHADSIARASGATGPALFVTGDKDWAEIFTQEAAFVTSLTTGGRAARQVTIPGGAHGFDEGDETRLSKLGEQALTEVLRFLNEQFPQTPARDSQGAPIDLAAAPTNTGVAPPTYAVRPNRSYPTTTWRAGGGATPTTAAPTTVAPPTTSGGVSTTTGVTVKPPVTTAPVVTTAPPVTTKPPVTTAPPITTAPPVTTVP